MPVLAGMDDSPVTRVRGEFVSLILGSTSHCATRLASYDVLVVKSGVREG